MKLNMTTIYRVWAAKLMDGNRTWTSAELDAFHRRNRAADAALRRSGRKPKIRRGK